MSTKPRVREPDQISIEGLEVPCVVGIHPEEREREQPLVVDIDLEVSLREAGYSGRISDTIDYDRVSQEVATLLRFREYRLLEMAAEEVAAMLLGVHAQLTQVRLSLRKPEALRGRARGARVVVTRRAEDYPRRREDARFGEVDVLYESREAGLYLLQVEPGGEISAHRHQVMRELEWRVQGELTRDGTRLEGLAPIVWPKGRVHRYENLGKERATVFCCDVPPFIPEDEIIEAGGSR